LFPFPEAVYHPRAEECEVLALSMIQSGQVWRLEETGANWLVTKVYAEVFTSYAILRKVGGTDAEVRRVKVEKLAEGVSLPGFVFTQEAEAF
jgi:hypothetical protein